MKKILLLLLIVLHYNSSIAQTSKYIPFPSSNAIWNVYAMFPFYGHCESYGYTFNGDTTINNMTYHKIRKQSLYFYLKSGDPNPPNSGATCTNIITSSSDSYAGAIREVVAKKKIYFLPPNKAEDTLLYDFNLKVGDSVKTYNSIWAKLQVESIDSVFV